MAAAGNVQTRPSQSLPSPGATTGAEKYYAKHGTGQGFLSAVSSPWRKEQSCDFSSPEDDGEPQSVQILWSKD